MSHRIARLPLLLALACVIAAATARTALGQDLGTDCDLVSFRVIQSDEFSPGQRITRLGRPVLVCPDGTEIQADSAVVHQATGRYELIGRVLISDPGQVLRASHADYYEREGRLDARGDVDFLDRTQGHEIRGETMVLLEAGATRPEDQVTVTGSPASALLPASEAADGSRPGEPYEVTGLQLRFEGDRFFWADDQVEVDRDGLRLSGDALVFDREGGSLDLIGQARMEDDGTVIRGHRINLLLPDDQLRSIAAHQGASLLAEELELRAEEIRITVEGEEIQRIVAVHRGDSEAEEGPPRPHALTEEFLLVADSIDLDTGGEGFETVHAVGSAWGQEHARGEPLPDLFRLPSAREVSVVEELGPNWIRGDTVIAIFTLEPAGPEEGPPAPAGAPDDPSLTPPGVTEEGAQYRLLSLEAKGTAAAFHRSPPEGEERGTLARTERDHWPISYLLADQIVIHLFEGGEVDRIEARGDVSGVQVEPVQASRDDPVAGLVQEDRR